MAEDVTVRPTGSQDTGNPVLDSFVNLFVANPGSLQAMRSVHELLLELAEKEPGGLVRRRGVDPVKT